MNDSRAHVQQYIDFLIQAGSKAEEVVDVPKEYPELLRAGAEYDTLSRSPGYKRLLNDLELRADKALKALRECKSGNPVLLKGLRDRWVEAEDSLKFVQVRVAEAIDVRLAIVKDLGIRFGDTGLDMAIDGDIDQRNIQDYMTNITNMNMGDLSTQHTHSQPAAPSSHRFPGFGAVEDSSDEEIEQ